MFNPFTPNLADSFPKCLPVNGLIQRLDPISNHELRRLSPKSREI